MKKIKKITAILFALILVLSFAACGEKEAEEDVTQEPAEKTVIAAVSGSAGIGLFKLKTDRSYAYDVIYCETEEEAAQKLENGEADVAALGIASAVKLCNDAGCSIVATTSLAPIHIVGKGSRLAKAEQLKGKTYYISEENETEQAYFRCFLTLNDIDPDKDVSIITVKTGEEVIEKFKANEETMAVLDAYDAADFFTGQQTETETSDVENTEKAYEADTVTTQAQTETETQAEQEDTFRSLVDISAVAKGLNKTAFIYGCLVARADYITGRAQDLDELLEYAEISENYSVNSNNAPYEIKEAGLFDDAVYASNIIKGSKLEFLSGKEMKEAVMKAIEILAGSVKEITKEEVPGENICFVAN